MRYYGLGEHANTGGSLPDAPSLFPEHEGARRTTMPAPNQAPGRSNDFNEGSVPHNNPMPQNIEAEKSVLAACMLNAEAVEELILKLKPETF